MTIPAAIVLAAGGSRRLGQPKQLLRIEGESLLRRTARIATAVGCRPVVVVLGAQASLLEHELEGMATVVVPNQEWEQGMSSSLRCGLEALIPANPETVLILVCDQPRLTEETLESLIEIHNRTKPDITASAYAGIYGVPAIFERKVFSALMELKGDQGARRIIGQPHWKVSAVGFFEGAIDIDLPSDLPFV